MAEPRRRIDWTEVRRQMAERTLALQRVLEGGAAWTEVVGQERAASLALPPADETPADLVLLMTAAVGQYAVRVAAVRRVEPLAGCTPVPQGPPALLGLAQCGGERWLLFDLDRLATPDRPPPAALPPDQGLAVLLRHPTLRVGLRCHRAEGLMPLRDLTEVSAAAALDLVQGLLPGRIALLDTGVLIDRVAQGL